MTLVVPVSKHRKQNFENNFIDSETFVLNSVKCQQRERTVVSSETSFVQYIFYIGSKVEDNVVHA